MEIFSKSLSTMRIFLIKVFETKPQKAWVYKNNLRNFKAAFG